MLWRRRRASDFDKEIEAHLDLEAERLKEQGVSAEEALMAARRAFGNTTRAREQFWESSRLAIWGVLLQDIRFGSRILAKNPGSTIVMIFTLAVVLGINAAIFGVLHTALHKNLAAQNPEELVMLSDPNAAMVYGGLLTGERSLLTYAEFTRLRDRTTTMSALCASELSLERFPIRVANAEPEQVRGRLVSENYFSTFGVQPALGRLFTQEDAMGVGRDPYAVISYDYWQRRFGGARTILGTPIHLYKTTIVIVGVAAKGFRGETVGQEPALWLPMLMQPLALPSFDGLHDTIGQSRDKLMWLHVFGRRKANVSIQQAQAEMTLLFRGILENDYSPTMPAKARKEALNQYLIVKPIRAGAFHGHREFEQQWTFLLALAALVLLVACTNVTNLLLARAAARSREIAIRLSLGAARGRLVRQFVTESLMLATLSGLASMLVAVAASSVLLRVLFDADNEFTLHTGVDWQVLGLGGAVILIVGVVFGIAPGLRATDIEVNSNLKEAGRSMDGSRRQSRLTRALVVAQVALSVVLTIGAGLFWRTLWNLQSVPLGYSRQNLLLIELDGKNAGYEGARGTRLFREIAAQLREIPGVRAISYSDRGLFSGFEGAFPVEAEGFTARHEADIGSTGDSVSPGYFSNIGIPILRGREFTAADMRNTPRVGVINQAFAKRFFAGQNPIGKHITSWVSDETGNGSRQHLEVVGVAGDARVQSMRDAIEPKFYVAGGGSWFEIRSASDSGQLRRAVLSSILSKDKNLIIRSARTLRQTIDLQNAQPRLIARLATVFGLLALVLAATGMYALLSYSVACRKNEIGIRMALGATPGRMIGMIFRETGWMTGLGVAVGIAATGVGGRLMATTLYGLEATGPRWSIARYEQVDAAAHLYGLRALDPLTIGSVVAVLCGLALAATYLPAARAARVNPLSALRNE